MEDEDGLDEDGLDEDGLERRSQKHGMYAGALNP